MIKQLRLRKAVIIVILGVVALIIAKIMEANRVDGISIVLGISGGLLILGSLLFLYPVLFAKKVDTDGKKVELQPVAKERTESEEVTETDPLQK